MTGNSSWQRESIRELISTLSKSSGASRLDGEDVTGAIGEKKAEEMGPD